MFRCSKAQPRSALSAVLCALQSAQFARTPKAVFQFRSLANRTHRADYDLSNPLTRSETLDITDLAEQARDDWNTLKVANPDLSRFFSVLLLLRQNLGARR